MNPVQALKHLLSADDSRPSASSLAPPPVSAIHSPPLFSDDSLFAHELEATYQIWSAALQQSIPASNRCYSLGVRDALRGIFSLLSQPSPLAIAIPADVYPVYGHLLASLSLSPAHTFPVIGFHLPSLLAATSAAPRQLLLLPSPLSPSGRLLTPAELHQLTAWLQTPHTDRWLLLDAVYDYPSPAPAAETRPAASLAPLLATERVFQLFSLSKTWIAPLTFGLVHCPSALRRALQPLLSLPDSHGLRLARQRMTAQPALPATFQQRFFQQWQLIARALATVSLTSWQPPPTGYFAVFPMPYQTLLDRGVLAIPPSLFGSDRTDVSLISCLHDIAPLDQGHPAPLSSFLSSSATAATAASLFHVIPLSNFIRGFDKYSRRYSKHQTSLAALSRYPDSFFMLHPDELEIGHQKALRLIRRLPPAAATTPDQPLALITSSAKIPSSLRRLSPHHLGLQVCQPWIPVDALALISSAADGHGVQLTPISFEEAAARSLQLQSPHFQAYHTLTPRSISLLPVASGCQAKCAFCFSHSSISHDQPQRRLTLPQIQPILQAARQAGAERAVITGGGEPGLLPFPHLTAMIALCHQYFPQKVVLITNGYFLSSLTATARQEALQALEKAGLSVLAVSRHGLDEENNRSIMKLATRADDIAHAFAQRSSTGLRLRWVCVLQRGGVQDHASLARYLDWVASTGASEVCFKELYVSTSHESVYHSSEYNQWSLAHQVSLSLITEFAATHGFVQVEQLPWGSPIFEGRWQHQRLRIAAYTEPSVFWERTHGLARSWNVLADGLIYASLEDKQSIIQL